MRFLYFTTLALIFTFANCTPDSTTQTDCQAKKVQGLYIKIESTVKAVGSTISVPVDIQSVTVEGLDCNLAKFTLRDSETFEAETTQTGATKIEGGDNTNEFSYNTDTQVLNVTYHASNGDVYVVKAQKEQ